MEGRRARRTRIGELIRVVTGNRGWRRPFLDAYPEFDSYQGTAELNRGQAGRSDDPALLRALEEWIPKVIENLPEWYQKQNHLISNPFDLEA
ncbi:hypothetical protein [Arundinibacter roseus]|uniref:Uncharacterized protein n=1 Tax=Arundinibacter roseus TaxID=2070510 RepID=A0A4R4KK77_9BACT|nr:hypothetical protein [Arundinibacter roseus]TDB67089.1 hypothetical protein EZE20_08220 [Arundinibacter roseus]